MERDKAHEIAVGMLKREHDRWIQNALVLFGALISISFIYEKHRTLFAVLALGISFMTVLIALTIRGSTDAWTDTVKHIEESQQHEDVRPYAIFDLFLRWHTECHGHLRDFQAIVNPRPKKGWWQTTGFRVTRLYTLAATLLTAAFVLLFFYRLFVLSFIYLCDTHAAPSQLGDRIATATPNSSTLLAPTPLPIIGPTSSNSFTATPTRRPKHTTHRAKDHPPRTPCLR